MGISKVHVPAQFVILLGHVILTFLSLVYLTFLIIILECQTDKICGSDLLSNL